MASYVVIMATWVWEEVGYFYMRKLQSGLKIYRYMRCAIYKGEWKIRVWGG